MKKIKEVHVDCLKLRKKKIKIMLCPDLKEQKQNTLNEI